MSTRNRKKTLKDMCDWVWYEYGRETRKCRQTAMVEVVYTAGVIIKEKKHTLRCWDHYLELEEESRRSSTLRVISARRRW